MFKYQTGFANHFTTEAIAGAIPSHNSPHRPPCGLYAEQLNGSAFTMPRHNNLNTWLYKIHPSAQHAKFYPMLAPQFFNSSPFQGICPPDQMRWNKLETLNQDQDFIQGMITIAGYGDTTTQVGAAIHIYNANRNMQNFFYNADGEMLIVPQTGKLQLLTEMGNLLIEPEEIAVIPRGVKFQIHLVDEIAYGYVCENYGACFKLLDLGPIGANGLANPRDFKFPVAAYNDLNGDFELYCKFEGNFWGTKLKHHPLDVVAWHGNYAPYKYDLRLFNTIGTISFDHPDPSIFTVLSSPSTIAGMANVDFVIFPPRWMVANNTFRPPYYHRNLMSEFMGLIKGQYDAKADGFVAGGGSLHNRMSAHGVDAVTFNKFYQQSNLQPEYLDNTMAFMFETSGVWRVSQFAQTTTDLQNDYIDCWRDLPNNFTAINK